MFLELLMLIFLIAIQFFIVCIIYISSASGDVGFVVVWSILFVMSHVINCHLIRNIHNKLFPPKNDDVVDDAETVDIDPVELIEP
jgi:hypothetical protein